MEEEKKQEEVDLEEPEDEASGLVRDEVQYGSMDNKEKEQEEEEPEAKYEPLVI